MLRECRELQFLQLGCGRARGKGRRAPGPREGTKEVGTTSKVRGLQPRAGFCSVNPCRRADDSAQPVRRRMGWQIRVERQVLPQNPVSARGLRPRRG